MRKLLFSLIAMFGLISLSFAQLPVNWTVKTSDITVAKVTDAAKVADGSVAMSVTWTSQSNQDIDSDPFDVTAGEGYSYSLSVLDNDAAGRVRMVILWLKSDGSSLSNTYSNTYSTDDANYQTLTITDTVPDDAAKAVIRLRFYDVSSDWDGDATVIVDNAVFTEGSNTTNLIPNPSFEQWSSGQPTKLLVTASPLTSYDGKTTLTITAVDDNGSPANVSADVAITLTQNGTGTLAPTTATIASGTSSVDVAVTYDKYEAITITATGDVNADGTNETATVDVEFKEALINTFPYTRDFEDKNITTDGWQVWHKTGQDTDGNDYYDVDWAISSHGNYIFYSSYDGGNKPPALAYFISPRIDVSSLTNPVLAFDFTSNFVSADVPLKVVYSTDYSGSGDPTGATWTELTTVTENLNSFSAWKFAGQFSLPTGASTVYVAFVYEAPKGESSVWQVDNIYIGEKMFQMLSAYSVGDNKIRAFFSDNVPTDGSVTADMFSVGGTAAANMDVDPNDPTIAVVTFANNFTGDNTKDVLEFNNPNTHAVDKAELYAGVLNIAAFNPASGNNIAQGDKAAFRGTVVYISGNSSILYDGTGDYSAIEIYNSANFTGNVQVGDSVLVVGGSTVYHGYPEVSPVVYFEKIGTGTLTASAMEVDPVTFVGTDAVTDDGAKYIGKLVTVKNVAASGFDPDGHKFWAAVVNLSGDKIWFDDRFYGSAFDGSEMQANKKYNVTGFVAYSWNRYTINPRSSDDIQEVVAAGVNDVNSSVKVYPNPATDYIMLSTQANHVDIYSTTGQLVKSVSNTNRVDVSSLQAGTYMARIYTDEGMVVKPFIKK